MSLCASLTIFEYPVSDDELLKVIGLLIPTVELSRFDWLSFGCELETVLIGELMLPFELVDISWSDWIKLKFSWTEFEKETYLEFSDILFTSLGLDEIAWFVSKLGLLLRFEESEPKLSFEPLFKISEEWVDELLSTSVASEELDWLIADSELKFILILDDDKIILLFELFVPSELVWFEVETASEVDISVLALVSIRLSEPDWFISKLSAVLVLDKTELELLFAEAKELLATSATLEKSDELVADSESEVELMFEGDKLILLFELAVASELAWSDTELLSVRIDDDKILVISELLFVSLILKELDCSLSSLEDILEPNEDWIKSFSLLELELSWFEEDTILGFSES